MVEERKLLYWEGSSKKKFKEFPISVQKDMGVALFVAYRACWLRSARVACVSEKVQVRYRHTTARCGIDREAMEGNARQLWLKREVVMISNSSTPGTDNVLAELGFDDAEELSAKAALALKFNELVDARGLNQTEAAVIAGMTQPQVSQIRRYKLQNISLERLLRALVSFDQHVEIVVRPVHRKHESGITVAAIT